MPALKLLRDRALTLIDQIRPHLSPRGAQSLARMRFELETSTNATTEEIAKLVDTLERLKERVLSHRPQPSPQASHRPQPSPQGRDQGRDQGRAQPSPQGRDQGQEPDTAEAAVTSFPHAREHRRKRKGPDQTQEIDPEEARRLQRMRSVADVPAPPPAQAPAKPKKK